MHTIQYSYVLQRHRLSEYQKDSALRIPKMCYAGVLSHVTFDVCSVEVRSGSALENQFVNVTWESTLGPINNEIMAYKRYVGEYSRAFK